MTGSRQGRSYRLVGRLEGDHRDRIVFVVEDASDRVVTQKEFRARDVVPRSAPKAWLLQTAKEVTMTTRKPMTKTRALREAQMWLTNTPPRVRKFRLVEAVQRDDGHTIWRLNYVPIAIAAGRNPPRRFLRSVG
jgi:hypothetical protein